MHDDIDDPFAAEDAAYLERVRLRREEAMRKWRAREGLIRLNGRPMAQVFQAFKRSLPSSGDAARLFDLVEARLGARAERDVWAAPAERSLLLRDPERPDWYLPQRLLYLHTEHQPNPTIPMQMEIPERLRRILAREKANEPPSAEEPAEEAVIPLSPGGRPARLCVYEGPANIDVKFGDRGVFQEWTVSTGDLFAFSESDIQPFTIDPHAKPPQIPPLSFLLRDEVLGDGVPLDGLAELISDLRPEHADKGRVYAPAVQPGTVTGAWSSGLRNLKVAEGEGRVGAGEGWVVIDAWNGAAIAIEATLDAAFEAWKTMVGRVQPLPPVERPAAEVEAEEEAKRREEAAGAEVAEVAKGGEEAEVSEGAEVTELPTARAPASDDVAIASTGMIRLEFRPPVLLDWPEPRPENVPAVAVPLPASPPVPDVLAALGFTRVVRLFGSHGSVAFAFRRDEERGFTVIGEDAVAALDLATLEDDITREEAKAREDWMDPFGRGDPWTNPRYPFCVQTFRVWDETSRAPAFASAGTGFQEELTSAMWGEEHRFLVVRVRVRGGG